jgi:hypothetical protein
LVSIIIERYPLVVLWETKTAIYRTFTDLTIEGKK